ncbi:MAG: tetratricopeptide repeat protein [Thermodesulfobacteriota bacterium]|jgi:tetratricopeptide (TPR) repeat protein
MSTEAAPPVQAVKGVFVTETVTTVGFGATKKRIKQSVYVYAEETAEGMIACRPLSQDFIPQEGRRLVGKDVLFKKFVPAPDIYLTKVLPAMRAVERMVDDADRSRLDGKLFTAEFEYKSALRMDEGHIRASFGLGLTYLEQGETASADIVFRRLSRLEGAFAPEHKHLFNEFGIKLRKSGMYSQALGHYARALRLSAADEHLHYNLARALYEKGRKRAAKRFLNKALTLRPDFPEALKFKEYLGETSFDIIHDSSLELDTFAFLNSGKEDGR